MTPEQIMWLDNFEDGILNLIESHEDKVKVYEMIFMGIRIFSAMSFDMAPTEKLARDTIQAGIDIGYSESSLGKEDRS
jgi:hypothetical protein